MGILSKHYNSGKTVHDEKSRISYARSSKRIWEATLAARKNFKYFWREVYWEHRRIIPGHDFAMVKAPFGQKIPGETEPVIEHMWINNINFDGENITGNLANKPHRLTNVSEKEFGVFPVDRISDWMYAIGGRPYGGFTIQAMRSEMAPKARESHDRAWGLDFGGSNEVLVVYKQKENPENLIEHPMSKNMVEKVREFLMKNPDEMTAIDEDGLTLFHREAIAGNRSCLVVLLEFGVDKSKKSKAGKTAYEYAKFMGWEHLDGVLK